MGPVTLARWDAARAAIVHDHTRLESLTMAGELARRLRKVADDYLLQVNGDSPEHLEAIMAQSIVPGD